MPKKIAAVLASAGFDSDPRHKYWTESLLKFGFEVLELEVLNTPTNWRNKSEVISIGNRCSLYSARSDKNASGPIPSRLANIKPETTTGHFIFRSINHVVRSVSLIQKEIREVDVLIVNDLPALVAVASHGRPSNSFIVYDAQEVFTESYDLLGTQILARKERQEWVDIETECIKMVDQIVTVSDGIAELYKERHRSQAWVVPNFVPREYFVQNEYQTSSIPSRFVFIGRADPHRGLEELVDQWEIDPKYATLDLIIPENRYLKKLRKLHKSKRKTSGYDGIRFCPPVPPDQIIETLSNYDVGIVPYNYPYPYNHCSPNKLGEYIAASLPVIANSQPFIRKLIDEAGIGMCFDWSEKSSFHRTVIEISNPATIKKLREKVNQVRDIKFSWETYLQVLNLNDQSSIAPHDIHSVRKVLGTAASIKKKDSVRSSLKLFTFRNVVTLSKNHARYLEPPLRFALRIPGVRKLLEKML